MSINNTEKAIIDAARKVFIKKGYHGSKLEDIAIEANVNQALLHYYYYRTKDKLFDIVLLEACTIIQNNLSFILEDESDIDTIIKNLIVVYVDTLIEHPYIPNFILNELTNNPEKVINLLLGNEIYTFTILRKIVKIKNKLKLRKSDQTAAMNLILDVISLNVFPFLIKPMIIRVFKINDIQFNIFMNKRKHDLSFLIGKGLKM